MIARTLSLLVLFSLSACQPADDGLALQADYLQRLNNAVEGDAIVVFDKMELTRYRFPPRRERVVDIPAVRTAPPSAPWGPMHAAVPPGSSRSASATAAWASNWCPAAAWAMKAICCAPSMPACRTWPPRSEEHTSELQSQSNLV